MLDGAAATALGAGMLAALNPCGFAILPAYLTLLVTGDQRNRMIAVLRALKMTAAMTGGFLVVFAAFGFLVAPVAYYGWWEIRVLRGGSTADPVIEAVAAVQQTLANAVASFGVVGSLVTLALLALLAGGGSVLSRHMTRDQRGKKPTPPAA